MAKNTVLILIMLAIAVIMVLDIFIVIGTWEEKPRIIAEYTQNFTIPWRGRAA